MIPSYQTLEEIEKRYKCTISVLYKQIYDAIRSLDYPLYSEEIYEEKNLKYPSDHKFIIIHASDEIKQQYPIYEYRCKHNRYYSWKTPMNIAEQACKKPDSIKDREIEILGYCGGDIERNLLEKNLPHNNPIYHDLYFMSFLKNPIGIDKIRKNLAELEKTFLNSFNFEIPFLPKFYLLRNVDKTGFYAENGHIIYLRIRSVPAINISLKNIENLINLKNLQLYYNHLTSLPESFGNLRSLENLELRFNHLTSLPESFGNLENLKILLINHNQLKTLPESFGNLRSLEKLILSNNHLSILGSYFPNFVNLKSLGLANCELVSLPPNFGDIQNLEFLGLENNSIAFLPKNFGNLKNLKSLNLLNNYIEYLPESFKNFKNCKHIDLMGNPIRSLSNTPFKEVINFYFNSEYLTPKGMELYHTFGNCTGEEIIHRQGRRINPIEYHKNILLEYYKYSPQKLTQMYVKNPDSLTQDEKERLIHEANHQHRTHLEEYLAPDDSVLMKISDRLKITLPNNLSLL